MELLKKDLSATRRQLVSVIVKYQEMQYELQTRDGAGDRNRNLTRDVYLRDKSREAWGDYHHPSEPPSVYLIDTEIKLDKADEHVIEEIIEDHERNKYDPEDFYERG